MIHLIAENVFSSYLPAFYGIFNYIYCFLYFDILMNCRIGKAFVQDLLTVLSPLHPTDASGMYRRSFSLSRREVKNTGKLHRLFCDELNHCFLSVISCSIFYPCNKESCLCLASTNNILSHGQWIMKLDTCSISWNQIMSILLWSNYSKVKQIKEW